MTIKGAFVAAAVAGLFAAAAPVIVAGGRHGRQGEVRGRQRTARARAPARRATNALRGPERLQGQGLDRGRTERSARPRGGTVVTDAK